MAEPERTDLTDRFARTLRASGLIEPGQTVLIALSGGLDSIVLLDLLTRVASEWRLRLVVAHFDHRMRAGSGGDASWVAARCGKLGLPLRMGSARTPARGEADAREKRYAFLRRSARAVGAQRIATAHHADDVIETLLFRIARGTGIRGLRGIPPRRGPLVRPLLPFRRAELEAHARRHGLEHRDDPTNRDVAYRRNRIRHELLPLLRTVAPGADAALLRLAGHARANEAGWDAVLEQVADEAVLARSDAAIELARPVLLSYHPQVRARLIRRELRALGCVPGRAGTRAALAFISSGISGRSIRLAGGIVLEREFDRIRIRQAPRAEAVNRATSPLVIPGPAAGSGAATVAGRCLEARWTIGADRAEPVEAEGEHVALDLASLHFPLVLRGWLAGDRVTQSYGTKKLKKLFTERRVGAAARGRVPVLADADGRVLWIAGVASAADVMAEPGGNALHLVVREC